jgi:pimeloyl-ACP methyl ester carboxylesterase
MPFFQNAGTGLYFEVHGDGRPLVFLHGGTVDFRANYAAFGWPEKFLAQGFQVVGLDFRGHGQSDKPHDCGSYGTPNVAGDVISLLDHLHLDRVDLIAYSIGTAMALHVLHTVPARVGRVALVATGDGLVGLPPHEFSRILPALAVVADRSEYPRDLPEHVAAYWRFIEASGGEGKRSRRSPKPRIHRCRSRRHKPSPTPFSWSAGKTIAFLDVVRAWPVRLEMPGTWKWREPTTSHSRQTKRCRMQSPISCTASTDAA